MSDRKTTPKAGITLLSREDDKLKFFHSPSGAADFALKHKFNKQLSLGLGFIPAQAGAWSVVGGFHAIVHGPNTTVDKGTDLMGRGGLAVAF